MDRTSRIIRGIAARSLKRQSLSNAALAAYTIEKELRSRDPSGIRAVYGVYLLETREVWAPHRGTAMWTGLADPPGDLAAFAELGNAVLQFKPNYITSQSGVILRASVQP